MSKRVARQRKRKQVKKEQKGKRKVTVILCSLLCLTIAVGLMAEWKMLPGMTKPSALSPASPSGSFDANSPSKEYIYAGGRLIATEEPAASTATLMAPTGLLVSATSTTQISLSWTAPTGATTYSYRIERSTNYSASSPLNHGFEVVTTISGTNYTDTVPSTSVATTYLYRVRSVVGEQQSEPCTLNFATTKVFQELISNQDPPGRTTISATHFLELQEAVNAVRAAAGLAAFTWSDPQGRAPGSGVPILRTHMLDLRVGLTQALTALGLTTQAYTDDGLPSGTFVRKTHIDELRQRTKGVGQQS